MKGWSKFTESHWFLLLAFLLLIGSLGTDFHFYYPDEHHYTDAALQMIKSGDYLTPLDGSNHARFNKPILTYWFVAAGFKLFGINTFGARIFFLLAGALVGLLVYYSSKLLYIKTQTAYLSMAVAVTQLTIIMSSTRTIPDILLCLFMAMAMMGFAGFISKSEFTPKRYHWMLYTGLALATGAKGLPALALGLAGLAFLLFNPWKRIAWKALIHWPAILVALLAGSWWFVLMFYMHGQQFGNSFIHDQVGTRLTIFPWHIAKNLLQATGFLAAMFIPWIFFIKVPPEFQKVKTEYPHYFGHFSIFLGIFSILLIAFVSSFYERYLLPVIPFISVWMGHLITLHYSPNQRSMRLWINILWVLHAILLSFALLMQLSMPYSMPGLVLVVLGVVCTLFIFINLKRNFHFKWLALAIMLYAFNLSLITRYISSPDEGEQIARQLNKLQIDHNTTIAFAGDAQVAAKIRIATGGSYAIFNLNNEKLNCDIPPHDVLIVNQFLSTELPAGNYEKFDGAASWNPHESTSLLMAIINGNYKEEVYSKGKRYYIFRKKSRE